MAAEGWSQLFRRWRTRETGCFGRDCVTQGQLSREYRHLANPMARCLVWCAVLSGTLGTPMLMLVMLMCWRGIYVDVRDCVYRHLR